MILTQSDWDFLKNKKPDEPEGKYKRAADIDFAELAKEVNGLVMHEAHLKTGIPKGRLVHYHQTKKITLKSSMVQRDSNTAELTEEQKALIRELSAEGMTRYAIWKKTKIGRRKIDTVLGKVQRRCKYSEKQLANMLEMKQDGHTNTAIAERYGCSERRVRDYIAKQKSEAQE